MTINGWAQIALFCGLVLLLTRPLGGYLDNVMAGRRTLLSPVLRPVEHGFYRLAGIDPSEEQSWWVYARAMIVFPSWLRLPLSAAAPAGPAAAQSAGHVRRGARSRGQHRRELPDQHQLAELRRRIDDELSLADGRSHRSELPERRDGIALAVALVRGFARAESKGIGNFWADMVRATLYVLLPFCVLLTVIYVWQGVPQNLSSYVEATTVEGAKQTIAQGPVASQLAIKMLGTNGGGFFNANSAHPYENPTAFSNLVQMLSIFAIGAALTNVFGRAVGDERQGWRSWPPWAFCSWPVSSSATGPRPAAIPCWVRSASIMRRATWRARKSASASRCRPCSP